MKIIAYIIVIGFVLIILYGMTIPDDGFGEV
jgi:hypothetical protein